MSERYRYYKLTKAWYGYIYNIRGRHKKNFSFHKYRESIHYAEKKLKKIKKQRLNNNSLSPHKRRKEREKEA